MRKKIEGTSGVRRWSVRHLQALQIQKMYAGGEVKGRGAVTGRVTQYQKPGQLDNLGIERVLVYAGKTLRPHRHHKTEAFLIITAGRGTIVLNGTAVPVRKGDVVSIPPRTVHGFTTRKHQLEFIAIQRPGVYQPGKREDLEVVAE